MPRGMLVQLAAAVLAALLPAAEAASEAACPPQAGAPGTGLPFVLVRCAPYTALFLQVARLRPIACMHTSRVRKAPP